MDGFKRDSGCLTNYHTHCSYCDGRAGMEAFVRFAISEGFVALGFSSHAPVPFPTRCNMPQELLDDYIIEFNYLKKKYASKIELYLSLEMDVIRDSLGHPFVESYLSLPLDYRMGSVHYLQTSHGYVDIDATPEKFAQIVKEHFATPALLTDAYEQYLDDHLYLAQHPDIDVIAHPFKMERLFRDYEAIFPDKEYFQKKIHRFFELTVENKKIVEVNTKSRLSSGMFFPEEKYFKMMREMEVNVVVNSDAHYPDLINNGRLKAFWALSDAGYGTLMEFRYGKWCLEPLIPLIPIHGLGGLLLRICR